MKKEEKREGGERGRGGEKINKSIVLQVTAEILMAYRTCLGKKSQE